MGATETPPIRKASPFVALAGRVVYGLLGWKCVGETPPFPKFVIIAAPHTSNWDGFLLILAAAMLNLDLSYFGKDSLFRGPLGWLMRYTGGIPLDRSRNQSFVSQAVSWFDRHERFAIGVAPEGTRRFTRGWKTGFYYIALQARVPVVLGFIDYSRKEAGILKETLWPSGDIEKDFELIETLYSPLTPRHPERSGPIAPLRSSNASDSMEATSEPALRT